MAVLTFKGGIHPFDGKALSKDKPITELKPGKELVYLVSQHIGAPAAVLVNKGDRVLVGQKIAEGQAFVSAHVHSSVSGTVKSIEDRVNATGAKVKSIVVENDDLYESVEFISRTEEQVKALSSDEIRAIVKEAGIVGMGGAGFPSHIKLTPKNPEKIDRIIVNAAPVNVIPSFIVIIYLIS